MKGQVKQVFVYIMTILVAGLVILIAARSFSRLDETRCSAEIVLFQRELGDVLQKNLAWGREEIVDLTKPCEYKTVCYVDSRAIEKNVDASGTVNISLLTNLGSNANKVVVSDPAMMRIIRDSVENGVEKNVFLLKKNEVLPIFYDPHLHLGAIDDLGGVCTDVNDCPHWLGAGTVKIPSYAYCVPARAGKMSFMVVGGGRYVLVRPK